MSHQLFLRWVPPASLKRWSLGCGLGGRGALVLLAPGAYRGREGQGWQDLPQLSPAYRPVGQLDAVLQLPALPRAGTVLCSSPGCELSLCAQPCNLTPPPAVLEAPSSPTAPCLYL